MKCVKYIGHGKVNPVIERVPDDYAATLVSMGTWVYCPKSEWKAQQKKEG